MIVRLMGEGQWRVDDAVAARLNDLDEQVERAVADGDEAALWRGLQELAEVVRSSGEIPRTSTCSRAPGRAPMTRSSAPTSRSARTFSFDRS